MKILKLIFLAIVNTTKDNTKSSEAVKDAYIDKYKHQIFI